MSGVRSQEIKAQIHHVEHHIAHLASSFFVSPFDEAAVVSIDGFGDFVGAMWGKAKGNNIDVKHRTFFPHSLGLYYLAFTQYFGFPEYGDEYKMMGLAAYGEPEYMEIMNKTIKYTGSNEYHRVIRNVTQLLKMNTDVGEPVRLKICFRSNLPMKKTMEFPDYQRVRKYLHDVELKLIMTHGLVKSDRII